MVILAICTLTFIIYFKNKDIFMPSILFNIGWIVSLTCFYFFSKKWQISLNNISQIIIFLGVFSFNFSSFFKIKKNKKEEENRKIKIYKITNLKIILIIIYLVASIIYIYIEMYKISQISGNTSKSISDILTYVRYGRTHNNITLGYDISYLLRINYCICLVTSLVYIRRLYFSLNKKKYLLVILLSFITNIFSGGRLEILSQILGIFSILIIDYKYIVLWKNKMKMKSLIKLGILLGIILLGLFIFHGIFLLNRINTETISSIIDNVAIYLGSSIACLNEYLAGNIMIKSEYFGYHTFITINGTLSRFINLKQGIVFFPNVEMENFRSNVYTSLFPYISDFGVFGMIVFQFIKGGIYQKLYLLCIKNNQKNREALILIYACLFNSLIFSFFEEFLFRKLNDLIILILICLILNKILLKQEKNITIK